MFWRRCNKFKVTYNIVKCFSTKSPSLPRWEWEREKATNVTNPCSWLQNNSSHVLSALFGLIYRPRDFASYMLGIFICNLLLYLAFYIIMKVSMALGASAPRPLQARWCRRCRKPLLLTHSFVAPRRSSPSRSSASLPPLWCGLLPCISSSRISAAGR